LHQERILRLFRNAANVEKKWDERTDKKSAGIEGDTRAATAFRARRAESTKRKAWKA